MSSKIGVTIPTNFYGKLASRKIPISAMESLPPQQLESSLLVEIRLEETDHGKQQPDSCILSRLENQGISFN